MTLPLELWWVLPAAVLFSTVAISSGVSGALFFSPFFMLLVSLSPAQAIGAALITAVFGTGNGLLLYVKRGLVDFRVARWILLGSIPSVSVGAYFAHQVPAPTLKAIFGVGLLGLAAAVLVLSPPGTPGLVSRREGELRASGDVSGSRFSVLRTTEGEEHRYLRSDHRPTLLLGALGGALTGMISAGLPEISTTQLIIRCRIPPRIAVATSVFALAITTLIGGVIHGLSETPAWEVLLWSIPGVLIGSRLGTRVADRVPPRALAKGVALIFAAVSLLVLWTDLAPG